MNNGACTDAAAASRPSCRLQANGQKWVWAAHVATLSKAAHLGTNQPRGSMCFYPPRRAAAWLACLLKSTHSKN